MNQHAELISAHEAERKAYFGRNAKLADQLAAKDREIAALTKQRDELAVSQARYAALMVRDETVAALREALIAARSVLPVGAMFVGIRDQIDAALKR